MKIDNLLSSEYTDLNNYITFTVENITNPHHTSQFSNTIIEVLTKSSDLLITYQEGNITLLDTVWTRYKAHPLGNPSVSVIIPVQTATITSYKFTFINTDYPIPMNSRIHLKLPITMSFVSTSTILRELNNLDSIARVEITSDELFILDGFPGSDLSSDNVVEFALDILNPYKTGETSSFEIDICHSTNERSQYFVLDTDLTANIADIAPFQSLTIVPALLRTNAVTTYTFTFRLGDGGLTADHAIRFTIPSKLQNCDLGTLSSSMAFGTTSNTGLNYLFHVDSDYAGDSVQYFDIYCRNPYTTRPMEDFVVCTRYQSFRFYISNATVPAMTEISPYASFVIYTENNFPRKINRFEFEIYSTPPISTHIIDEIEITVAPGLEILNCMPIDISGIIGSLACTTNLQVITITGITQIESLIQFNYTSIRNPSLSTNINYFILQIQHSNGYIGKRISYSLPNIECNFPCRECTTSSVPDYCTDCYSNNNEAFFGGNNLYLYYDVMHVCLEICPSSTLTTSDSCLDCTLPCKECHTQVTNCTQCYADKYLLNHNCIDPCPSGYAENDATRECDRNYIYIYIYSLLPDMQ